MRIHHRIDGPGLIPAPTFGRLRFHGSDASMTPAGFTLRVLPRRRLCDAAWSRFALQVGSAYRVYSLQAGRSCHRFCFSARGFLYSKAKTFSADFLENSTRHKAGLRRPYVPLVVAISKPEHRAEHERQHKNAAENHRSFKSIHHTLLLINMHRPSCNN